MKDKIFTNIRWAIWLAIITIILLLSIIAGSLIFNRTQVMSSNHVFNEQINQQKSADELTQETLGKKTVKTNVNIAQTAKQITATLKYAQNKLDIREDKIENLRNFKSKQDIDAELHRITKVKFSNEKTLLDDLEKQLNYDNLDKKQFKSALRELMKQSPQYKAQLQKIAAYLYFIEKNSNLSEEEINRVSLATEGGILGVDKNNNGIRDDIDNYLLKTFKLKPDSDQKVHPLLPIYQALARGYQKTLQISNKNLNEVKEAAKLIYKPAQCISLLLNSQELVMLDREIEAMTFNTPERMKKYTEFNEVATKLDVDEISKGVNKINLCIF